MTLFNTNKKVSQCNYSARLKSCLVQLLTDMESCMVQLRGCMVQLSKVALSNLKSCMVQLRTKNNRYTILLLRITSEVFKKLKSLKNKKRIREKTLFETEQQSRKSMTMAAEKKVLRSTEQQGL